MSERATPETGNDTQFELAAWELLKEARQDLADYKASAERARDAIIQAFLKVAGERDEAREKLLKQRQVTHGLRELARELLDALENCREDSAELLGEFDWMHKAGGRNGAKYQEIKDRISVADLLIDKAKDALP